MLQLDDPGRPLDASTLDAPGGFAWWYLDALDEAGNGAVCIWSYGLPFLPGLRADRLAGDPRRPRLHPSLNLALYRQGRPAWYSLLTLPPERVTWDGLSWQFGDSTLHRDDGSRDGRGATLTADLDLPCPGSAERLRGRITLTGPRATHTGIPEGPLAHAWTPLLGAAQATVDLTLGDAPFLSLRGSGYHDRNASHTALDALGIDHWTWGRAVFGDTLVIHYLTWPAEPDGVPVLVVVQVGADGAVTVREDVRATLRGRRRSWMGMTWWRQVDLHLGGEGDADALSVQYDAPVDDGPFYLRCQTRVTWRGQQARGWAELCRPDRIDLPRHRPLVQMCVQREQGRESMWLPLFAGPHTRRLTRLLAHWRGGRPLLAESNP
ncbi:MAG: hypothetical protein H6733_01090 [Alphaproteobacteria bacterium]|nr:hypothetical protein [Alphaproteobacteria bacterium]